MVRKWKRAFYGGVRIAQVYWYLIWWQCCGARAEIISFGSVRPRLRIVLYDTLKIGYFDLTNRIKIVTIYKNFFSGHDFFCQISSSSVIFRKEPEPELEPEPQFVISALAPGGNLIRLRLRLHNPGFYFYFLS
jgi:hypothetical protein